MSKNSRIKNMLMKQAKGTTPDVWEQIDRKLGGQPVPQANPQKSKHNFKLRYAAAGVALVFVAAVSVTLWKLAPLPNAQTSSSLSSAVGSQAVSSLPSASAAASSFNSSPVPYSSLRFSSSPDKITVPSDYITAQVDMIAFTEDLLKHSDIVCKASVLNAYIKEYNYDTYSNRFEPNGLMHNKQCSAVYEIRIDDLYYNNSDIHIGDTIKIEDSLFWESPVCLLSKNHQYILPLNIWGEDILHGNYREYASGDIKRDGIYGILYPNIPQIEITLDNQYVFCDAWKSLINDKTVNVTWDMQEVTEFHSNNDTATLKLRQDADFINDFKALITKYKS